jgi:tRNA-binding protein
MPDATFEEFRRLDLRVGRVVRAEPNSGARDPAYRLWVDLGDDTGIVQSSAKVTERYGPDELVGRQVVVVAGFPSLRVGGFRSDVLVLGVETDDGVTLLGVDTEVEDGSRIS